MKKDSTQALLIKLVIYTFIAISSFLVGVLLSRNYDCNEKLTPDGILQAVSTLLAIAAATFLLPMIIQSFLDGKKAINIVLADDLKKLIFDLEKVITIYKDYYDTQAQIGIEGRQKILEKHTDIVNLAMLIDGHSSKLNALSNFKIDVVEPLGETRNNFSDLGLPDTVINEERYLQVQKNLNSIIYKLKNLRYELH